MRVRRLLLMLLLMMVVYSCEYQPWGGGRNILTNTKEESKQRQMFICSYIPLDTIFEYHDSLIDIKLTMKEAYAEIGCWTLHRWPPYHKPRYMRDSLIFIFHCVFDTDSSTTPTRESSEENNWWEWNCYEGDQRLNDFWCDGDRLADETRLVSLDTLAFPVYFNKTYKSIVWPGFNIYERVPIGFIRFVRDTADCEAFYYSICDTIIDESMEYFRCGPRHLVNSLNWHTVEEMNAKYKNGSVHKND